MRKHRALFRMNPIKRIALVLVLASLASSLIATIWALFIKQLVGKDSLVGFISSFLVLISFVTYFLIIPLIERYNKYGLALVSSFFIGLGYISYTFIKDIWVFLILSSLVCIFIAIRITTMGLIVEHNSKKKKLCENEGFIYMLLNGSYLIGPLIVGWMLSKYNLGFVFILAGIFMFLSIFVLMILKINKGGKKKKIDDSPYKNFKDFFKDKNRLKNYILSAGINFWWSLVFVYVPLRIIMSLSESYVGYFLFAIPIPLVFLELYFSKLTAKIGYRKIFFFGFLIPSICALFSFFFFSNIWVLMGLMIFASIGIAMTESTTESYFFDLSKGKEDQRFYGPYNTAIDVGNFIGEFLGAVVIFLIAFKFIFIFYTIIMLALTLLSLSTKNIIESRRKN